MDMRPPRNYFVRTFQRDAGMLSRVADSLYWMSRYLERAEHTARLVDVELQTLAGSIARSGRGALEILARSAAHTRNERGSRSNAVVAHAGIQSLEFLIDRVVHCD